jgi:2-amino-4-hydroxy-6-hydroxymethyldihydropteridine diphosphokinase
LIVENFLSNFIKDLWRIILLIVPLVQLQIFMSLVYLSLGSNKGDRLHALAWAFKEVSDKVGEVVAYSSIYETEPWGFISEQQFFNQVLVVDTILEPASLINTILEVEILLGRKRHPGPYESREIDIDILIFGDRVLDSTGLQIPHPRLHQRMFVLEPLVEIAPLLVHPIFGITVRQLIDNCEDASCIGIKYQQMNVLSLFEESLRIN